MLGTFLEILGVILCLNASIIGKLNPDRFRHPLNDKDVFSEGTLDGIDVTFSLASQDSQNEISKYKEDDKMWLLCHPGRLVPLFLNFKRVHFNFVFPFNVSCEMLSPPNLVSNLTMKIKDRTIHLYWNTTRLDPLNYVVHWMNNDQYHYQYVTTNRGYFYLVNVVPEMLLQICVATIDRYWRTSKYLCTINYEGPVPVTNLKGYSTNREVYVTWDHSNKNVHNHDGYVIDVTSSGGLCRSILVNMKPYCIHINLHCLHSQIIPWTSLQPLRLEGLSPSTQYIITVSSVRSTRVSFKKRIIVHTLFEEAVSNICASLTDSTMVIEFIASDSVVSRYNTYRLKVTLNNINICTVQHRTIFDEVVNKTKHSVEVNYWNNCCDFLIEVTPISNCAGQGTSAHTTVLTYRPIKRADTQPLTGIAAQFLSRSLLKLSWSDTVSEDECINYGFMVDVTNIVNVTDCKVWILARRSCIRLVDKLSGVSRCKNEEQLRSDTDVVRTSIMLHGRFKSATDYRVRLWAITEDVRLLFNKTTRFIHKSECFIDCYGSIYQGIRSASKDGRICLPWKDFSNVTIKNTYRSNICSLGNKPGNDPQCIASTNGKLTNCDVPKCGRQPDHIKCVAHIEILSSRESVSFMWSKIFVSDNAVPGYITLLQNVNQDCERYHVQGCTDCFKLLNLSIRVQSLYMSCHSGTVTNDLKHESTFDGLQPNKEYIVFVIPLIDSETVGEIRKVTVATRVSDTLLLTNIEVTNKSATSLQFQWDDNIINANYYQATLVNTKSMIEQKVTPSYETVLFRDLDICTKYCFSLSVVTKSGQSEFIDTLCTYTMIPRHGVLRLDKIESGPYLKRIVTWTKSDCYVQYRLVYWKKYFTEIFTKIINDTAVTLDNLERNFIYTVKVKPDISVNSVGGNFVGEYSQEKEFFTGPVNPKIDVNIDKTMILKGKVTLLWTLNDSLSGSMFEFVVHVKDKSSDKCLLANHLICDNCAKPFLRNYVKEEERNKLKNILDCSRIKIYSYKMGIFHFTNQIESALGFSGTRVAIYGVNLLGLHRLYEADMMQ